MRAVIFVTFALLAGCSGSLERAQAVRDAAPDWYEARKVEISGNDYPRIGEIPVVTAETRPGGQLAASEAETVAALHRFSINPRSAPAQETPAAILAWASAHRRAIEGRIPAPDFLSDEDVARLKAMFNTPRGRF